MFISMVPSKRIAYLAIPVFFLFLATTSFPEALAGGQQKPDALIKEGIELYNTGQYEDAIIMLKQATGLTKDKRLLSDAFFCLSLCYSQLGAENETREFIRKTIEVDPKKKIDENRYSPEYYALFMAILMEPKKTETGNIQVKSSPDKAQIFLDGTDTGKKTNSILKDISLGDYTIKLVKEEYMEQEQEVSVKQGKTEVLEITLQKIPTETMIKVGEEPLPKPPGSGTKWGRIALIGAVVLLAAAAVYFFVLMPKTGSIQVNSNPAGAKIFLDGTDTGKTTSATLEEISPGEHTVKLIKDGYAVYEQKVTVKKGKTESLNVDLVKDIIKVTMPETGSTWPKGRTAEIKWTTTSSTGLKSLQGAGRFSNMTDGSSYLRRLSLFQARAPFWRANGKRGPESEGHRSKSIVASSRKSTDLRQENGNPSSSLGGNDWSGPEASFGPQGIRAQGLYVNPQKTQPQSLNKQNLPFAKTATKSHRLDILKVNIDLYKGAEKKETIAPATDNDGNETWNVPTTLADGTDYKVMVSCSTDANVYGESGLFSIQEGKIEITMPTLDKVWERGKTEEITWTSTFSTNEKVSIDLLKGTDLASQIVQSTKNSGSCSWTIPSSADFEEYWDYRIRIALVSDASVKGESPSFIITKLTYVAEIDRTVPNYQPHGVTVDSASNVWVTQTVGNQLHNLGPSINYPGIPYYDIDVPKGIAADTVGNTYVVENGLNKIMRIDTSGGRESHDGGDHNFANPYGIALDTDYNVYVTDSNNRVQKFNWWGTSFSFVTSWGTGGNPRGIACDPNTTRNSVYVVDGDNKEVHAYTLTGEEIRTWSINGNPFGIAVDKWGFVYVIDRDNDIFLKYTPKGTLCCEKGGLQDPIDICVDRSGRVLVTDWADSRIIRLK